MGALLLGVAVTAALVVSATLPSAQTPSTDKALTPADLAAQALNTGRYDEVDPLLKGATDPRATTLRARAAIARGRYAEAEKMLTAAAASAPGGDAALELGLLQQYLGKRQEARRTLQRVMEGTALRTAGLWTSGTASSNPYLGPSTRGFLLTSGARTPASSTAPPALRPRGPTERLPM